MDDLYQEMDNMKRTLVIVEGPKDRRSLERLGFLNIVCLDRPLYQIVEEHEDEEEILVLTDLDPHGRRLYKYFYNEFTRRGVRVNNRLRIMIMQTPVRNIEGLANWLSRQEEKAMMIEQ